MGEEQIVMFQDSGVGAEEVVSSNDFNVCFVDTGEVSDLQNVNTTSVMLCSRLVGMDRISPS